MTSSTMVMPRQRSVLSRYVERRPIFHHYRVEEQLEAIYQPKVSLPSGGSLVIDTTEAMVTMEPARPWAIMSRAAACATRKVPVALTA